MAEVTAVRQKRENPIIYLFDKTWTYSKGNRKNIVLYWILFILANIASLTTYPFIIAKVINIVQKEGVNPDNIKFILLLLGASALVSPLFWSFHGPARLIERANAFRARANYRKFLIKGIMSLPLDWHADHHSGETIDKIEKGTQGLYSFSSESFQPILFGVRFLICCVLLVHFSPSSGIVIACMICLTVWITMRFDKVIMANYKILNKSENEISATVLDTISNITTVIILRVEKLVFDAISHQIDAPYKLYKKNNRDIELKWFLVSFCCATMMAAVLGLYLWQSSRSSQGILIGSIFLLVRYLEEMSELFFKFTEMYSEILQRQSKVFNSEELSVNFKSESFTNHVLPEKWKCIRVEYLNFSYNNAEGKRFMLKDVCLQINRGERIAFVGRSGSGKTTLLKVIRDLHASESIRLYVDDVLIPDGFAGINRAIALVPQSPEIFATTIRKNITIGAEYTDDKIRHYTDMACFSDVVAGLPKGLESSINEKGVNLSVGQQQRLALSRGLLACEQKSLILLDEPTSSLDSTNELNIYKNIFSEFKGTSIISSIHRLHLLPYFDRIYMFEEGRILNSGTFAELKASCPEFQVLLKNYNAAQK